MSDKIKRFIECFIPVTTCNLRCHYCYITQQRKFSASLPVFEYTPEHIAKALSKERLGGTCFLNFCGGGETMLPPEITPIVRECLKEGHYAAIVTNGTVSQRINEILEFPKELLERLFFKFSFQYLELKRLNWLDKFCENIDKVRNAGCSFTVEITPSDELVPYIDEIKQLSMQKWGALPHITIARADNKPGTPILTNYSKEEYKKIWDSFDSPMFTFKLPLYNQKRREFCYAGVRSFCLDIKSGDIKQCYKGESLCNIYKNINEPLTLRAVGYGCKEPHCYNAHGFLLLDDITHFSDLTYADIRNRICTDGSEWLTPKVKEFFSSKLSETNEEYNCLQKSVLTVKNFAANIFSIKNDYKDGILRKQIKILGIKLSLRHNHKRNS